MKSGTTTTKTKGARSAIMARVNTKAIHTVRHIHLTIVAVLLMWQAQRFIITLSPLADL